jgi:tRNA/rRNA methyltransferase
MNWKKNGESPGRRSALSENYLSEFSVAFVEPEFAQNVGYLARAMANFGLNDLLIVSANDSGFGSQIDKAQASKFASHGDYIIRKAKSVRSVDKLRDQYRILVGTTAIRGKRKSNITRKTLDIEKSVPRISRAVFSLRSRRNSGTGNRAQKPLCFVFGRDTTGLTNEELRKCDYNITIVTGTEYNALNISHAAAIIFYSFAHYLKGHSKDLSSIGKRTIGDAETPTRVEKERVVSLFQELAENSDFQDYKKERLREAITRLLDRSNPSLRELYLLMGLASKARTKIRLLSP